MSAIVTKTAAYCPTHHITASLCTSPPPHEPSPSYQHGDYQYNQTALALAKMNGHKCKPAVAFLEEASGSSGAGGSDGGGDNNGGELPIADIIDDMSVFTDFKEDLDALAPGSQVRASMDQMETTRTPARPSGRSVRRVSVSSSTPPFTSPRSQCSVIVALSAR